MNFLLHSIKHIHGYNIRVSKEPYTPCMPNSLCGVSPIKQQPPNDIISSITINPSFSDHKNCRLMPFHQVQNNFFESGLHQPFKFHINIFIIGLGVQLASNHTKDGFSLVSLNVHACLRANFSLMSPRNRFTACLRIPN